MNVSQWTHRYKYKIKHNFNQIVTGETQVGRVYSDDEVLTLAKKMSNAIANDAVIIECKLIETRAKQ